MGNLWVLGSPPLGFPHPPSGFSLGPNFQRNPGMKEKGGGEVVLYPLHPHPVLPPPHPPPPVDPVL